MLAEDQLDEDLDITADFRERAMKHKIHACKLLHDMSKEEESASRSSQSQAGCVKLPKLELEHFSGEITEWQTFYEKFTAMVREDLHPVSKFTYLQSLLEGDAKRCIDVLKLTAANYGTALKLLEERFGRKERIICTHIQHLLNVKLVEKSTPQALRKLQEEVVTKIRSLETLGVVGTGFSGLLLTPIIFSKLPTDI